MALNLPTFQLLIYLHLNQTENNFVTNFDTNMNFAFRYFLLKMLWVSLWNPSQKGITFWYYHWYIYIWKESISTHNLFTDDQQLEKTVQLYLLRLLASRLPHLLTYKEQLVAVPSNPHKEIIWFDVTMDERFAMNVFNTTDHLIGQHKNRLNCESSGAKIE